MGHRVTGMSNWANFFPLLLHFSPDSVWAGIKELTETLLWKHAGPWHSPAAPASPPWVGRPSRRWIQCSRWRRSSQWSPPSTWKLYRQKMCSLPPLCCKEERKWGQRQTWCLSKTTSETKSSVTWRNFRLNNYVNIFACGEKVTNSMCGRRKLYIEEVSRTLAVNDVPKMKSCHLPLIFQELWWQIKLPVIKANPVLKRSSIKGVERIKDCCRLRPGQHTIRCQALTRGLQCSLYYLVYIQNFQPNYLGVRVVHLVGRLGHLSNLSIRNSDQLETDVLGPRPGGPTDGRHCNGSCCELSNLRAWDLAQFWAKYFMSFLDGWIWSEGDTWVAHRQLASIVDLGVGAV